AGRDNLARMAFSFLGGFVVMLSGVCLPVVGPLLLGGHLAWVDLTGPALTRRGESLGTSLRRCGTLPGRWPWKLLYGWAGIVAGLNAILLPIWVAAATALVVESDKRADFLGKDDCIR
ncbi:MAG: hypothetical protein SFX74_05115, partial [Fimbriimonadaceae bacterium]|nr:hypothetical protein [Fimbriimonadaceae bacterium]